MQQTVRLKFTIDKYHVIFGSKVPMVISLYKKDQHQQNWRGVGRSEVLCPKSCKFDFIIPIATRCHQSDELRAVCQSIQWIGESSHHHPPAFAMLGSGQYPEYMFDIQPDAFDLYGFVDFTILDLFPNNITIFPIIGTGLFGSRIHAEMGIHLSIDPTPHQTTPDNDNQQQYTQRVYKFNFEVQGIPKSSIFYKDDFFFTISTSNTSIPSTPSTMMTSIKNNNNNNNKSIIYTSEIVWSNHSPKFAKLMIPFILFNTSDILTFILWRFHPLKGNCHIGEVEIPLKDHIVQNHNDDDGDEYRSLFINNVHSFDLCNHKGKHTGSVHIKQLEIIDEPRSNVPFLYIPGHLTPIHIGFSDDISIINVNYGLHKHKPVSISSEPVATLKIPSRHNLHKKNKELIDNLKYYP